MMKYSHEKSEPAMLFSDESACMLDAPFSLCIVKYVARII